MTTIVHYELYRYDVRGWTLQARYAGDERDTAIRDATAMENSLKRPVRVIRETYHTDSNLSKEVVAFVGHLAPPQTRGFGKPAEGSRPMEDGGHLYSYTLQSTGTTRGTTLHHGQKTADVIFPLTTVMLVSFGVALLGTAGVSLLLNDHSQIGMGLAPSTKSLIIFLFFLSLFLITAVPLVMLYVPLDSILGKSGRPPFTRSAASKEPLLPKDRGDAPLSSSHLTTPEDMVNAVIASQNKEAPLLPIQETATTEKNSPRTEDDKKEGAEQEQREQNRKDQELAQRQQQDKDIIIANIAVGNWASDEVPPLDPDEWTPFFPVDDGWQEKSQGQTAQNKTTGGTNSANPNATTSSSALGQARLTIMKFLHEAVAAIKTTHPVLDAQTKVGFTLYMAGACDDLAMQKQLSAEDRDVIMGEMVDMIGTPPEQRQNMIKGINHYRSERRYHQVMNAGRLAMDRHMARADDPFVAIDQVMKEWNTPQNQDVIPPSVTILFADRVGSADRTPSPGKTVAQNATEVYDSIVHTAVSHHAAKNTRHTGNGIMVSFDAPSNAVKAAIEIQTRARAHGKKWPDIALAPRIGINSGDPIAEENDPVGATAHLAARLCAAAGPGQIWLSDNTRALLAQTTPYCFLSHGPQPLKGVKTPCEVFEVAWNEKDAAAFDPTFDPTFDL